MADDFYSFQARFSLAGIQWEVVHPDPQSMASFVVHVAHLLDDKEHHHRTIEAPVKPEIHTSETVDMPQVQALEEANVALHLQAAEPLAPIQPHGDGCQNFHIGDADDECIDDSKDDTHEPEVTSKFLVEPQAAAFPGMDDDVEYVDNDPMNQEDQSGFSFPTKHLEYERNGRDMAMNQGDLYDFALQQHLEGDEGRQGPLSMSADLGDPVIAKQDDLAAKFHVNSDDIDIADVFIQANEQRQTHPQDSNVADLDPAELPRPPEELMSVYVSRLICYASKQYSQGRITAEDRDGRIVWATMQLQFPRSPGKSPDFARKMGKNHPNSPGKNDVF